MVYILAPLRGWQPGKANVVLRSFESRTGEHLESNGYHCFQMHSPRTIDSWLLTFKLDEVLHAHIAGVLHTLPDNVRSDLIDDPCFSLCDFEPGPGVVFQVPLGIPKRKNASRAVVLKRTLRTRPPAFVRYVIAHEFAHAHLRNAGRWPGDDPEEAADALAAEWGHPRPARNSPNWPWPSTPGRPAF